MTRPAAAGGAHQALRYRWVYPVPGLQDDAALALAVGVLRRAKAAGYNGAVIGMPSRSDQNDPASPHMRRIEEVKRVAGEIGLDLIPTVMPCGYAGGLAAYNRNLLEGLPVRDALFVARGGTADVVPDPPVELANGGFEAARGDTFAGWAYQDRPGSATFADRTVHHAGAQSMRVDRGPGRVVQTVGVSPYRQYHFTAWVRTDGFETADPDNVGCQVRSPSGRALAAQTWKIRPTQDWAQYHVVFNSLDADHVHVSLGVWEGSGRIWFDDARLEETGLLNVIRREGCPLTVCGDDGTVYEEERDYHTVRDDNLGGRAAHHEPPALRLTAGSRIREGQRLRVSYYHTVLIYVDQYVNCMSHPEVFAAYADQIARAERLLHPPGFFLSHDEIRVANQCAMCRERGMTPGELLADNVRRCAQIVRGARPDAEMFLWSDMFDPFHNAVAGPYYLVDGSWAGSWEGLPPDAVIVNWYFDIRKRNLPWFARLGHKQILAGYYDSSPDYIRTWLDDARGVAEVAGVIYTTWQNRFEDLEAFAGAAWGG